VTNGEGIETVVDTEEVCEVVLIDVVGSLVVLSKVELYNPVDFDEITLNVVIEVLVVESVLESGIVDKTADVVDSLTLNVEEIDGIFVVKIVWQTIGVVLHSTGVLLQGKGVVLHCKEVLVQGTGVVLHPKGDVLHSVIIVLSVVLC
jgi:hypothetical protein